MDLVFHFSPLNFTVVFMSHKYIDYLIKKNYNYRNFFLEGSDINFQKHKLKTFYHFFLNKKNYYLVYNFGPKLI